MINRNTYILTSLISFVVGVINLFLGLRFVLKLFGASPQAEFVSWLYATTDSLLQPFLGMFPSPVIERGMVLEFSTLFAILTYSIIGWLLEELILFISASSSRGLRA